MSLETAYAPAIPSQQPYRPMSIGDWILTHIVLAIPLVGFVMMLVWAFSSDTQPSKKTFCQAGLILMCVGITLLVIAVVAFGGLAAISAAAQQNHAH